MLFYDETHRKADHARSSKNAVQGRQIRCEEIVSAYGVVPGTDHLYAIVKLCLA